MSKRLLYIHNAETSFVKIDCEILSNLFEVNQLNLSRFKLFNVFKIARHVKHSEIIFIWFSSWFSFLPIVFAKLFSKPIVLVTGGYDTANVKKANYGNQRHWLKKIITNWNIKQAQIIIVNSHYIYNELSQLLPNEMNKVQVILHGIEPKHVTFKNKAKIVLNIGNVSNENLHRKGILPFVKIAKYLPDYKFVQIGNWRDSSVHKLKLMAPGNVVFLGRVSDDELNQIKTSASIYMQLSLHEAFGMSVIESMQYGVVPIVSHFGALPEVVDQHGIVVKDFMPLTLIEAINTAENKEIDFRIKMQDFVNNHYSIKNRAMAFQKILSKWL